MSCLNLPPIVNKTVTREVRNLWIEEVRRKTKLSGHVSYEIKARGGGKEIYLEVAADGWVLYKKVDDADDGGRLRPARRGEIPCH